MTLDITEALAEGRRLLARPARQERTHMRDYAALLRRDAKNPHVAAPQATEAATLAIALEWKSTKG